VRRRVKLLKAYAVSFRRKAISSSAVRHDFDMDFDRGVPGGVVAGIHLAVKIDAIGEARSRVFFRACPACAGSVPGT
jgi:hypothetical protein